MGDAFCVLSEGTGCGQQALESPLVVASASPGTGLVVAAGHCSKQSCSSPSQGLLKHPSFIPGMKLVMFFPSKSPHRCVCGIQGCPRGQPDLEEAKVLQDKPWGHWCCQPPSFCLILPKLGGQISLLTSDKTHPDGSECMTFPESWGGLGPFCFLGCFILK